MIIANRKILSRDEIDRVSSAYLNKRGLHDVWEILQVEIEDRILTARIRMRSYFVSPTDPEGFHQAQTAEYYSAV